ncbi:MAG: 4Fe-4S dicluster domain-containing protein [Phycisphaerae bacterium]
MEKSPYRRLLNEKKGQTMKVVYPVPNRCINCHLCEVACIVQHSRSQNPISAYCVDGLRFNWEWARNFVDPTDAKAGERPMPLSRCKVSIDNSSFASTMCRHCEIPDCVLACKNGSLYKDASGRTMVDEEKCVGCWMCVMACRFGVITRNIEKQNVSGVPCNGINHHCDLCPGRSTPACVAICPTQALVCEEREEIQSETDK